MTNQNHQSVAGTTEQKQVTSHVTLPLNKITIDPDIQQREQHIDPNVVDDYAEAMSAGENFPPVNVFGDRYILADGFHRVEAARKAGLKEITVDVRDGNHRDAILYAVGSNAKHGIRRSRADKRKAIETLLSDDEWIQWGNRKIANHVGVSPTTVGTIRSDMNNLSVQTGQMEDDSSEEPRGNLSQITRKVERTVNGKKQVYNQTTSSKSKQKKMIDPEMVIEKWKSAFVDLWKLNWTAHDGFEVGKRCISGLKKAVNTVTDKEAESLLKELDALYSELNRSISD